MSSLGTEQLRKNNVLLDHDTVKLLGILHESLVRERGRRGGEGRGEERGGKERGGVGRGKGVREEGRGRDTKEKERGKEGWGGGGK